MPNMQLSKNLISLRRLHRFTQDDVSDILNISRQAYSNYENMKRNPDLESLILLSSLYHVSLDVLINYNVENEVDFHNRERNLSFDINTGNTLYLTLDETYLVMQYRRLNKEKRSTLKDFVHSLLQSRSKA